jgi:hypothetical protein
MYMNEPSSASAPRYLFRELADPAEIVALLRLRHRIYFEQSGYGSQKPLQLDLTAHDLRSRLFGVFRGTSLIGGLRLVFRSGQPAAPLLRAIRAVVQEVPPEAPGDALPSEEAFDVRGALGECASTVDVEVGRLMLLPTAAPPAIAARVVLATLAAIEQIKCRLYLYSCAVDIAKRYARFSNPRHQFEQPIADAIGSDGFVFPRPTVAAVAKVEDSPYWTEIKKAVIELEHSGQIVLGVVSARAQAQWQMA